MTVALVALALTAAPAVAQPDLPAGGSELFRGLLHRFGFTPFDGDGTPRLVVVFGDPGLRPADLPRVCQSALAGGGSVLVAADRCERLRSLFPDAPALAIDPFGVRLPEAARRLTAGPVVEGLRGSAAPTSSPAVPDGVAVDYGAGRLRQAGPGRWTGTRFALRGNDPFGACGDGGGRPGRAVVLAGESVFANRLLAGRFADDTDTGNLEFAVNVVRWLKPPGDAPVSCLFVEYGRPASRFDDVNYAAALLPPVPSPPTPPLSAFLTPEAQAKLTDAGNEAFDRFQANDRLNRVLGGRRLFPRLVQWALGVLALLAAVALVRRARAAREPAAPPPPAVVERPPGLFAQRREELLRGGDHTAAVREYLAELFRTHGLPLDEYRHPTRLPRVRADADIRRQLRTLWGVAYGPDPVTYSRWKELEPMIEAVRAAGAAGRWAFAEGRA